MRLILLFLLASITGFSQTILKKNNLTGVYYANCPFKPGEVVYLEGTYSEIDIRNINAPEGQEIIFKNKGRVTVTGSKSGAFCFRLYGKGFKFLIDSVDGKNGLVLGNDQTITGIGFHFANSSYYQVSGAEIKRCEVGFFSNPSSGQVMKNITISNNYLHDFKRKSGTNTGTEKIYFGWTGGKATATFDNCVIENNLFVNGDGDAVQVCNGTFIIRYNRIKNFATGSYSSHRNGILSGTNCTSQIYGNTIEGGKGVAITILGGGKMSVHNNIIKNNSISGIVEDLIYINGRDGNLALYLGGNVFENNTGYRKIIGNYTTTTYPGGMFEDNLGVTKSQTTLKSSDKWIDYQKLYYNVQTYKTLQRDNCGPNYSGGSVLYSVPAGKYTSTASQAEANMKAEMEITENGQDYANSTGVCEIKVLGTINISGIGEIEILADGTWRKK